MDSPDRFLGIDSPHLHQDVFVAEVLGDPDPFNGRLPVPADRCDDTKSHLPFWHRYRSAAGRIR